MQRTFRVRPYYRDASIAGLVFFGGMSTACIVLAFSEGPLFGFLLMASFWLSMGLLSAYLLRSYYVYQLKLDELQLEEITPLRTRTVVSGPPATIQWKVVPQGGAAVVTTWPISIRVNLEHFEREDRVRLIHCLRHLVQASQQSGWPEFCQRWALPLVEPPRDDSEIVLLKRAHIDRLFAWMLLPSMAITAALIHFGGWEHWPSLFALVPFWIVMRFLIPAGGARSQTWQTLPGAKWWLVSFVGLLSGSFARPLSPWLAVTIWGLSTIAFVQFLCRVRAEDRRRREHWEKHEDTADARWRELTATLAME